MLNRQSKIIFSVLLVVSILLHGLAWWWVDIKELLKPDPLESTTVQVSLKQPQEKPKPPPPAEKKPKPEKPKEEEQEKEPDPESEQHLPMHNADTFSSSNNTDPSVTDWKRDDMVGKDEAEAKGDKKEKKKTASEEATKAERAKKQQVSSKKKSDKKQQKNKEPVKSEKDADSESKTKQVYSKNKSDKLKMQNLYLKRMTKQIRDNLIRPDGPVKKGRGTIAVVLDSQGYLVNAEQIRGSGDFNLDLAVIEAIKRVHRYEVPTSMQIADRYYSQLTFAYDDSIFNE